MLILGPERQTIDITCPEWEAVLEGPGPGHPGELVLTLPRLRGADAVSVCLHGRPLTLFAGAGGIRGGAVRLAFRRLRDGESVTINARRRGLVLVGLDPDATGHERLGFDADAAVKIERRARQPAAS